MLFSKAKITWHPRNSFGLNITNQLPLLNFDISDLHIAFYWFIIQPFFKEILFHPKE